MMIPSPLAGSTPGNPLYPSTAHHEVLIGMVRKNRWTLGAEIGLLKGKTFDRLLTECPNLTMIGVDRWEYGDDTSRPGAETYTRHHLGECERSAREIAAKFGSRAVILKGDSVVMADAIDDGSLDFVFIDAGHTEESVRADIAAWKPKIRSGGMLTGHDWWFPSVRAALDDVLPYWVPHDHSVWSISV